MFVQLLFHDLLNVGLCGLRVAASDYLVAELGYLPKVNCITVRSRESLTAIEAIPGKRGKLRLIACNMIENRVPLRHRARNISIPTLYDYFSRRRENSMP